MLKFISHSQTGANILFETKPHAAMKINAGIDGVLSRCGYSYAQSDLTKSFGFFVRSYFREGRTAVSQVEIR